MSDCKGDHDFVELSAIGVSARRCKKCGCVNIELDEAMENWRRCQRLDGTVDTQPSESKHE